MTSSPPSPTFTQSLLGGALAGTSVDVLFYPIDTIKTRLQSSSGFLGSGGLSGIYRGLGSVVVGSAPGASLFFVTYDTLKSHLPSYLPFLSHSSPASIHLLAASGGEIAACLIRVPTEVIKSRQQTSLYGSSVSTLSAFRRVVAETGARGLYQGFGSTVAREIPFASLQFPLYESLKSHLASLRGLRSSKDLPALQAAACGSVAGGIAAAVTTPLDVAKTRIMLSRRTGGVLMSDGRAGRRYREYGGRWSTFRGKKGRERSGRESRRGWRG